MRWRSGEGVACGVADKVRGLRKLGGCAAGLLPLGAVGGGGCHLNGQAGQVSAWDQPVSAFRTSGPCTRASRINIRQKSSCVSQHPTVTSQQPCPLNRLQTPDTVNHPQFPFRNSINLFVRDQGFP